MPTTDAILRRIEEAARREYLPIIGADKGRFLERLVREKRPHLAVEVGALTGYASILIARNLDETGRLISIEISGDLARTAAANVAAAGLAAKVEMRLGDAREVAAAIDGPVDFVLLDAQKSQYLGCLKKLEPKLRPGAVVVANGTGAFARQLAGYLDYVRDSVAYRSVSHVFGVDAVEVSIFKESEQQG